MDKVELRIDQNYREIIYFDEKLGCIVGEIYNPFGLAWVNHVSRKNQPSKFKELFEIIKTHKFID